jgi:hypothetical protein
MDPHILKRFKLLAAQLKAMADHNVPWYDNILPGKSLNQQLRSKMKIGFSKFLKSSFQMEKQTWSWFGRMFDSRTESTTGFLDHDINNEVSDIVNGFKKGWKGESTGDVVDEVVPEEYQSPVAHSSLQVLEGEDADLRDQKARQRDAAVINDSAAMGANREQLSLTNPSVELKHGIRKMEPAPSSCVRLLN